MFSRPHLLPRRRRYRSRQSNEAHGVVVLAGIALVVGVGWLVVKVLVHSWPALVGVVVVAGVPLVMTARHRRQHSHTNAMLSCFWCRMARRAYRRLFAVEAHSSPVVADDAR